MSNKHWKHWFPWAMAAGLVCGSAVAQEQARVLSATPVVEQVATPQQFCADEQVYSGQRTHGTGAIVGAVIGGVAGNAMGSSGGHYTHRGHGPRGHRGYGHHGYRHDSNRGTTTIVGAIAGGLIGHMIESSNSQPRYETVRRCTEEVTYTHHTVGYDVTYEYAGRRYTTRMAQHPGAWVPVSVQPQNYTPYATTADERFVGPSGVYQPAPAGISITGSTIYAQPNYPAYPAAPPTAGYWR